MRPILEVWREVPDFFSVSKDVNGQGYDLTLECVLFYFFYIYHVNLSGAYLYSGDSKYAIELWHLNIVNHVRHIEAEYGYSNGSDNGEYLS